ASSWEIVRIGRLFSLCTPCRKASGKNEKPAPYGAGGLFGFDFFLERDNSRHQPLVPHLVDLALEVFDVFVDKMREPSLLEQVIAHRKAFESSVRNVLGLAVELQ